MEKTTDKSRAMGTDSIGRLMLRFSIPAIVGMVANALYNIVDRLFVGQTVGASGIGAISVVFPFTIMVIAYGLLIGVGAGSYISMSLGEKRRARAEKGMGNAILLIAGGGIVLTLVGFFFAEPILRLSGSGDTLLPMAMEYMGYIVWGVFFSNLAFGLNYFIRAEGNPRYAMFTLIIGAGANVALDAWFILVLDMGVAGAAIATLISQVISASWAVAYYVRRMGALRFRLKNLNLEWRVVKRILAVGSAPALAEISFTYVLIVFNRTLRLYGGDLAISAMGIFFSLDSLFFLPVLGLAGGVQPIISYNYGAKNYDRVIRSVLAAIKIGALFFTMSFTLVMLVPGHMIRLFSPDNPELLAMGARGMRLAYCGIILASVSLVASHTFQAIGKARIGIFLTLSRHFFFILLPLFILPPILGIDGVWLSMPLSDLGGAMAGSWFLRREFREMRSCEALLRISLDGGCGAPAD